MHTSLFVTPPGWETALLEELSLGPQPGEERQSRARILSPGLVMGPLARNALGDARSVAQALQCLPAALPLGAPSVSTWANCVAPILLEGLEAHSGPWRLHVFRSGGADSPVPPSRSRLVEAALLEQLKRQRRSLVKALVSAPETPFEPAEALVQLVLETPSRGWLSICLPEERHRLRRVLSRFPAGEVLLPEDTRPPSSAWRKLAEAQQQLGRPILKGERCVDLGACPGGWSFVALQQGASVVAVDRSPLREDLMRHPRLSFVQGDAFRYLPEAPVDWMLSDVIAFPGRILELLEHWLTGGHCRRFCVTVKFRGREDYGVLEDFKQLLEARAVDFRLQRLGVNRNEVTAMGECRPASLPST